MNIHVHKMICMMVLLLSAFTSQMATPSSLPQTASPLPSIAETTSKTSLVQDTHQTESTTTRGKVGSILGSLLILSLYAFPMSFAENWAFGDPKKARKRPKKESSELKVITDSHTKPTQENGEEEVANIGDWTTVSKRLPQWVQRVPQVTAGLAAGGCLMIVVVVLGAVAFALYHLLTGQREEVSQILPRFAYWFPFALLGMVADMPFQIFYWEDRRLRVLLRLMIWWFPRIIIITFVINPPILQELDPTATALTVLAIDGVLAAFCLGLYTAREQLWMNEISA
jgi:hypothetical protein